MTKIEKSGDIMIKQNLVDVFNFVADPSKFSLWQPFVVKAAKTSEGPVAVGTTYSYSFQVMGHMIETSGVITEYQPFSRYCYQSTSGPFPIKGGFTFQKVREFVQVTAFGEAETEGYFSMAKFMVGIVLERQINKTLQNLKKTLENRV